MMRAAACPIPSGSLGTARSFSTPGLPSAARTILPSQWTVSGTDSLKDFFLLPRLPSTLWAFKNYQSSSSVIIDNAFGWTIVKNIHERVDELPLIHLLCLRYSILVLLQCHPFLIQTDDIFSCTLWFLHSIRIWARSQKSSNAAIESIAASFFVFLCYRWWYRNTCLLNGSLVPVMVCSNEPSN